ncbi:MAG: hypothetical protein E7211_16800 [Clostridium lundense]|nr:hypothetical protein [Clostridium lundense]
MDNDLLNWVMNELDEKQLQDICKNKKIKVPGFRSIQKYPKFLMIPNLLKSRIEVMAHLKDMGDQWKENSEFEGKNIIEIESLIDIRNRNKAIQQIIYLMTRDELEYKSLANKTVDKIIHQDNITNMPIMSHGNSDKVTGELNNMIDIEETGGMFSKNQNQLINLNVNSKEKEYDNNEPVLDNKRRNDEKILNKFIVNVEFKNNYYNIYPLYNLVNGEITEVDKNNYPDYGNINVYPFLEFSKKNYDIIDPPLWVCEFSENELEEIENKIKLKGESRTRFKINGDKLIDSNRIYDISNEEIYQIVELVEDDANLEEFIYNDKIEIKNKPIKEKVYIKDNNYIYGPFGYKENNKGGGYQLDKTNNNYIIYKYPIKDNELYMNVSEIGTTYSYNRSYITVVYFHDIENLKSEVLDVINDEELLGELKKLISIKNTHYSSNEIKEIRENINFIINNSLSEERRERIRNFIINTEMTEEFIENDLIDLINLLLDNKNTREKVANKILEQNDILRKLQNVELVQSKIESKNEELEKVKQELEKIQLEIQNTNNENEQKLMQKMEVEMKEMENKKQKLEKSIEEISKKYELLNEIDEFRKKAKEAEDEYNVFSRKSQNMKNQVEKIEKEIREKLENATSISKYSDIAFDGMIANEMLESAAKWNKERYIKNYENSIATKEKVEKVLNIKEFNNKEVIDYIYNKFKKFRDYSKNDIINMMMCISQGFITVFAGEPGVGKTSTCNIIANILGLSNKHNDYNRFTEVSVEKGWTSKRDLIGYYNPLTKSFDKNNGLLFKTFNILNEEYKRKIKDFPYYILLDEANLSSMEHYWADFMNCCDLDKEDRKINLGEDYIYYIPKTLKFLATINYDHTTETLSPRLIDRSWIILLDPNKNDLNFDDSESYKETYEDIIMFKDLETIFSIGYKYEEDFSRQVFSELDEIYKKFNEGNIAISPRIHGMITNYLKVGCSLFDKTESTPSPEFVALDYAVAQKLLPKISGYGEEYKIFLKDIQNIFDKNNMVRCKNIVDNIIKKGNANMQYYQFFA